MSRPADWTPLAAADPVPGDPAEVALAGRRLRQVADQISADVSWLRSLCTARFWYSGAGQAFHGRVDDAAAKLAKARERYLAASEALGSGVTGPGYAGALEAAQSLSLRALAKAQRASFAMRTQLPAIMAANEGCPPYAGTPPVTLLTGLPRLDASGNLVPLVAPAGAGPELSATVSKYNASALEYQTAKGWLAEAVALRDEAAARAAALIQAATGADGLQDQTGRLHDITGSRSTRRNDQTQCG
jgi:hypothetical protein